MMSTDIEKISKFARECNSLLGNGMIDKNNYTTDFCRAINIIFELIELHEITNTENLELKTELERNKSKWNDDAHKRRLADIKAESLTVENDELRKSIEGAMRVSDLWLYGDEQGRKAPDEARAMAMMRNSFEKVLAMGREK